MHVCAHRCPSSSALLEPAVLKAYAARLLTHLSAFSSDTAQLVLVEAPPRERGAVFRLLSSLEDDMLVAREGVGLLTALVRARTVSRRCALCPCIV